MELKHKVDGAQCSIACDGAMSGTSVAKVKEFLEPFLNDASIKEIVLDMANVSAIDSSGVGVLVRGYRVLMQRNAQIKLEGVRPKLQEIFKITGLDKIFAAN